MNYTSSNNSHQQQPSYERWECYISSKQKINSYVGYVKAQFLEDKRKYVVVKARGQAVENALKVVQIVKENLGGISSCTRFYLQFGTSQNEDSQNINDRDIQTYEEYEQLNLLRNSARIIPAVEIQLSTEYLNTSDPGFEKPAIRIEPIFTGGKSGPPSTISKSKKQQNQDSSLNLRQIINDQMSQDAYSEDFLFSCHRQNSYQQQPSHQSRTSFKHNGFKHLDTQPSHGDSQQNVPYHGDISHYQAQQHSSQMSQHSDSSTFTQRIFKSKRYNDLNNAQIQSEQVHQQSYYNNQNTVHRPGPSKFKRPLQQEKNHYSLDEQLGISITELDKTFDYGQMQSEYHMEQAQPLREISSRINIQSGKQHQQSSNDNDDFLVSRVNKRK